jgi:hypothetical protein
MSENIIQLPGTNAAEPAPQPQPLTLEVASRLALGIRRLAILNTTTVATANRDAEIRGIQAMLLNELPRYGNELVGCWFAIHQEYEPLVEAVASILRRASDANQRRVDAINARKDAEAK